jgi:dTDP-4-amino-4,6-dideoxygalactose transaminase
LKSANAITEVPFFRYPHVFQQNRRAFEDALVRVASAGAYILQKELADFEARLADYCGVKHAIGVANASDGLELNLATAGVGVGDEVLLSSHTFVATAAAIVSRGATPVFVEIGHDHEMDPDDLERRVMPRAKAVMPTQLNGRTADMDRIGAIARKHSLVIVEDSAQGLGSRFKERMAGTFGHAGVFSFYPAKTLGCFGDGGAVVTDDDHVADETRRLRDHGRDPATGEVVQWGRNSRLDNLQAGVLSIKLDSLDDEIARRRILASRYHANLADVSALSLPPPPNERGGNHFDVFQNYEMEADRRDELRDYLSTRGVGTILQWGGRAVHEFAGLKLDISLPRTEYIMRRSVLLPMNTSLTLDEVDYVSEVIRDFYAVTG